MEPDAWLITRRERGNPATRLDENHDEGTAWSDGNLVQPLIHGEAYFAALAEAVSAMRAGDLLLFTDWRGDPDQRLNEGGTELSEVLCGAAERGVLVRSLIWRSHFDRWRFSEKENRRLSRRVEDAGGECLLDMRVRTGGSHHQKFVVLRHPDRPELDVAFVGGIDLCHGRRDDGRHLGDPQPPPMAPVYGARPAWHDVQCAIRGPAVGDVETVFRERWEDPGPLSRNPVHWVRDLMQRQDLHGSQLPPRLPAPKPRGPHSVELLRTYPRRVPGYPFAPEGERSIARSYLKVLRRARDLVYLEDQYLWSSRVAEPFADALAANPDLTLIAVIPRFPAEEGRAAVAATHAGRNEVLRMLEKAGGDRFAVYGLENHAGTPVYVHAKVVVIDDVWASIGSDNLNLRSWTHDSELACAVLDETPDPREPLSVGGPDEYPRVYARSLRLALAREHLDRADGDDADLCDPRAAFQAYADTAAALEAWHAAGCVGARPPGRVRAYTSVEQSRWTRLWATLLYQRVFDPDGRPRSMRRARKF